MSYLHCLSHLLLNSNGAADSKWAKNRQGSWVIELPLNECPELSVVFLTTKKPNLTKMIFRIHRTEVIPQKPQWGLHQQEVSQKSCLPSAPSPSLWWRNLLTSTVGKLLQARRVDEHGEGARRFFKEQQPPWVPSACFLNCTQCQRKVAQEKVGAVLTWELTGCPSLTNHYLSQKIKLLLGKMLFVIHWSWQRWNWQCKIDSLIHIITWLHSHQTDLTKLHAGAFMR